MFHIVPSQMYQFIQYHWHMMTLLCHCGSRNHNDELMTRLSPCCDISYITWQVLCSVVFAFEVAGCLWCLADWVVLSTSSGCVGGILIVLWYLKQHLPESWGEFSLCEVYKSVSAGIWNSAIILSPVGKFLSYKCECYMAEIARKFVSMIHSFLIGP